MKKRIYLSLLIAVLMSFCLIITPCAADLPSPSDDFYVSDSANVLSEETENHILEVNDQLQPETGAQIVVVTVDFLGGLNSEEYAYQLFNAWKIGSSEKNNGVLILIAPGEEKFWITVGRGLETTLSSGQLSLICTAKTETYFDNGDYDRFVTEVFDGVADVLADYYNVSISENSGSSMVPGYNNNNSPYQDDYPGVRGPSIMTLIFLFILVIVIVSIVRSWLRAFGPTAAYRRPRTRFYRTYRMPGNTFHHRPPQHRPPSSFGGMGGGRINRPSSFGNGLGGNSARRSSSSFGSSFRRSSGFGGSSGRAPRSGGGGGSRGGGFGRK